LVFQRTDSLAATVSSAHDDLSALLDSAVAYFLSDVVALLLWHLGALLSRVLALGSLEFFQLVLREAGFVSANLFRLLVALF